MLNDVITAVIPSMRRLFIPPRPSVVARVSRATFASAAETAATTVRNRVKNKPPVQCASSFELCHSFVIRHSDFVISHVSNATIATA